METKKQGILGLLPMPLVCNHNNTLTPNYSSQKSLVYFESSLKPITFEQKLNYTEVFRQTDISGKHKKPILQIQKKLQ